MRGIGLVAVLLAAQSFAGVQVLAGQGSDASVVAPQPSVELPADLDRVLRDYERHWSAGAAAELAALFVEDGLIVRDDTWIRGREAITEAYRIAGGPLRLRAIEYATDGDVGYIVGAYGYGPSLPTPDVGLFVLTLRQAGGGRWLIVSDMDRSGG